MISRKWLEEWCEKHNATLLEMRDNGFLYQTYNGMTWFMDYETWIKEN